MKDLRQLFRRSKWFQSSARQSRSGSAGQSKPRRLRSETLERRELLASDILASSMHNPLNPYDVNADYQITPADALGIINRMAVDGEGEQVGQSGSDEPMYYDVNNDNLITAVDALGVINALSRGEGANHEQLELFFRLRDLNDNPIAPDANGEYNLEVGQQVEAQVSWADLRLFENERLGVFSIFVDGRMTSVATNPSHSGAIKPTLFERQQLILGSEVRTTPTTMITLTTEDPNAPVQQRTFTRNEYVANTTASIQSALADFGYTQAQIDQFVLRPTTFVDAADEGKIGTDIFYKADSLGNVDVPNITITATDGVPTENTDLPPVNPDGSQNFAALPSSLNLFSNTFRESPSNPKGDEFYTLGNRGTFSTDTGFIGVGGVGPLNAGGVPAIENEPLGFGEEFDAFSVRFEFTKAVQDLTLELFPNPQQDSILLYSDPNIQPPPPGLTDDQIIRNPLTTILTFNVTEPANPGQVSITPLAINVQEDGLTATLNVERTGGTQGQVTVDFATADGTATAGSDYTASNGTVTFADGDAASKQITIPITDDTIVENNETFTVTISNVTGGATLGDSQSTVTIIDNDVVMPGTLAIDPASVNVNEGDGTVTVNVTRTGGADGAVSVDFATADGTANAGSDYTSTTGTLNFADGSAVSQPITVPIIDDTDVENNETFTISLSNVTGGATLGNNQSTVTIIDNDVQVNPGILTISPLTPSVNENGGSVALTINRTGGSDGVVTVNLATTPGTATAGVDYTSVSQTVTFADGVTSQTVNIPILDDAIDEPNETFTASISNPTGGAVLGADVTSTVTIIDDDEPVFPGALTIDSISVGEADGTATLTVTRSNGSDGAVSANFATSDGTANAGFDYVANSGTVNFADGQTSATISISILDDFFDEPNETFTVTLSNPTGGATLDNSTGTVTIVDNDEPGSFNPSSIGGGVFIDHLEPGGGPASRNGMLDPSEPGLGGMRVHLSSPAGANASGQEIAIDTWTLLDGRYGFDNLPPGTYTVTPLISGMELDESDQVIYFGPGSHTIDIGPQGGETITGIGFPIIDLDGSARPTQDILASNLLPGNGTDAHSFGVASLALDGSMNFIVGRGFESDVIFAELALNDTQDQAVLTQVKSNGDEIVSILADDQITLRNGSGIGVEFRASAADVVIGTGGDLSNEFPKFGQSIDAARNANLF